VRPCHRIAAPSRGAYSATNMTEPDVPRTQALTPGARKALLALVVVCVVVRVPMLVACAPMIESDTGDYVALAHQIQTWDFSGYTGSRTPIYPLLILAAGYSPLIVELIQMLTGIAVSVMIFSMALRQTRSATLALVLGLACCLSLNLLLWEKWLMTEALATFLLTLSLWVLQRIQTGDARRLWVYVALGLIAAACGLTRPLMYYYAPLLLLFLPLGRTISWPDRLKRACAFALPALLPLLWWCGVNARLIGVFSPSTLGGYGIIKHVDSVIAEAPAEYDPIVRPYLMHRDENGSHLLTIHRAEGQIEAATGLSPAELSTKLTRLSLTLIRRHPYVFVKSAYMGWSAFWQPGIRWQANPLTHVGLQQPAAINAVQFLWSEESRYENTVCGLFLVICGWAVIAALTRRRWPVSTVELCMMATVLCASVVQAVADPADAGRYVIPFVPAIYYVVGAAIWRFAGCNMVAERVA